MPARESRLWLVRHADGLGVLRRLDPDLYPVSADWVESDLGWLHGYLAQLHAAQLNAVSLPTPPLPVFDGVAWQRSQDAWWELVTYLPGEVIGWRPRPSLAAVGEVMAALHLAKVAASGGVQRPSAIPLSDLCTARPPGLPGRWIGRLAEDLVRIGHQRAPRAVIHGDLTAHNVLAAGDPPEVTGVIDFALAHVEDPRADIGFGLWRSGRPFQDAVHLDFGRVSLLVCGYHRRRPLAVTDADAVAVYIRARGVQQAVKQWRRTRHGPTELLTRRIDWLTENEQALRRCIRAELADHG